MPCPCLCNLATDVHTCAWSPVGAGHHVVSPLGARGTPMAGSVSVARSLGLTTARPLKEASTAWIQGGKEEDAE